MDLSQERQWVSTIRRPLVAILVAVALAIGFDASAGQPQPGGPPPSGTSATVGGNPGGSQPVVEGVDLFSGSYRPSVPLSVLPAHNDLVPDLTLVYAAERANGWIGAGWGWAFAESIQRRGPTGGVPGGSNAEDDFYVGADELLEQPDGTYRSERDPFTVYEPITDSASPLIIGWRATRDGTSVTYGAARPGSYRGVETGTPACGVQMMPVAWHITERQDSLGNTVQFDWEDGDGQRAMRPRRIRYNGGTHVVDFVYQSRPDARVTSTSGRDRVIDERLFRVRVKAVRGNGEYVAYQYRFDYRDPTMAEPERVHGDAQSLLSQVVQEAVDPQSAAISGATVLRRFEYEDVAPDDDPGWADWAPIPTVYESGGAAWTVPDGWDFTENDDKNKFSTRDQLVDINGDGLSDYLVFNVKNHLEELPGGIVWWQQSGRHRVFVTSLEGGSPSFVLEPARTEQLGNLFDDTLGNDTDAAYHDFWIVDLNGDRYADIVSEQVCFDGAYDKIVLGGPGGWYDAGGQPCQSTSYDGTKAVDAPWMGEIAGVFDNYQLADLDGDGLVDLVGESEAFLNSGEPPFFDAARAIELSLPAVDFLGGIDLGGRDPGGSDPKGGSSSYPETCMRSGDDAKLVKSDLAEYESSSDPDHDELWYGVDEIENRATPSGWVWRHTTFRDYNGDGIADRLVALAWPEADTITTGYSSLGYPITADVWVETGNCGGVNALYLGDGRGGFIEQGYGIGGDYDWGDPRAMQPSHEWIAVGERRALYRQHVSHVGLADIDGSGRAELFQLCNGGWHAASHRGAGVGWGFPWSAGGACPSTAVPGLPTDSAEYGYPFLGGMLPGVQAALVDLNGDTFPDGYLSPNRGKISSQSLSLGGDQPMWSPNQRTGFQNRLTLIEGPHRGQIEITWGLSDDDGVRRPVVTSVTGKEGRTDFVFTGGVTREGEFVGFRRAEAVGTSGVRRQWEFRTAEHWQGSVERVSTFWPDGSPHQVDVFVSSNPGDTIAPYFNPTTRSCKFAFYADQTDGDVDFTLPQCLGARDGQVASSSYRLLVTDAIYDSETGKLVEERNLRDVSTFADTTATTYRYGPQDPFLVFSPLIARKTVSSSGETRGHLVYSGYQGIYWGTETQYIGGAPDRERARGYAGGALAWATGWEPNGSASGAPKISYARDRCGQPAIVDRFGMESETITRDELCRVVREENSDGLVTILAYDGFGRVTSEVSWGKDGLSPQRQIRYAYDSSAGPGQPAEARIELEPDGSNTVVLTYVDGYGRTWKTTRCKGAYDGAGGWSCDGTDPSTNDYPTHEITLYSAYSGDVVVQTSAFDDRDGTASLGSPSHPGTVPEVSLAGSIPRTVTSYDLLGRPRSLTSPDGMTETRAYDVGHEWAVKAGVTTELVTGTTGDSTYENGELVASTQTNAFGEEVSRTDALGHTTELAYDAYGRRISVRYPQVPVHAGCGLAPVTSRPMEAWEYTLRGEVASEIDANGNVTSYEYDDLGRRTAVIGPDGAVVAQTSYDDPSCSTRCNVRTDDLGNRTTTWLDARDRPIQIDAPDGTSTTITYDARGRKASRALPHGELVTYAYDRQGRVRETSRIMGTVTSTTTVTRDARGNVIESVDGDGRTERFVYDEVGRLLTATVGNPSFGAQRITADNSYDGNGRLSTSLEDGVLSRYSYDARGRVTLVETGVDPGASPEALAWTATTYTARGEVATRTNALGEGTRTSYDAMGRAVEVQTLANGGVLATRSFEYDAGGNQRAAIDPAGRETCTEVDVYDRPVAVTRPGAGTTTHVYTRNPPDPTTAGAPTPYIRSTQTISPTGEVATTYTDGTGREFYRASPDGTAVEQVFDVAGVACSARALEDGLLCETRRLRTDGAVEAVKPVSYYPDSSRVHVEYDWVPWADASPCVTSGTGCNGRVWKGYTAAGRIQTVTDSQGAGNQSWIEYSTDGQMRQTRAVIAGVTEARTEYHPSYVIPTAREIGPAGQAIRVTYARDRNLHLVAETRTDGTSTEVKRFAYDAAGRPTWSRFERNGSVESEIEWTYDAFGRKATKSYEIDGAPYHAPGGSYSLRWSYNPDGQLRSLTYPSGNVVSYFYGADGNLQKIVRGTSPGDPLIREITSRDEAGRPLSADLGNGALSSFTYDASGRQATRDLWGAAGLSFSETYGYDPAGRLTEISRSRFSSGQTEATYYQFDERDYLLSEEHVDSAGSSRTIEYVMGKGPTNGLREAKDVYEDGVLQASQDYVYGTGHRLESVDGGATTLGWDVYGRQLDDPRGNELYYSLGHQLVRIVPEDPAAPVEQMLHDAAGQRVARIVGSDMDYFLSDDTSGQVLHHARADGSTQDVVRAGGGVVAFLDETGAITPMSAARADDLQVVGNPDAPIAERAYSAYGELMAGTDDGTASELGFHQTWKTREGSLRIAGVRAYDPDTGRFLTPDPLGFAAAADILDAGDVYRYAHNNPVAISDSTGYMGELVDDHQNDRYYNPRLIRPSDPKLFNRLGVTPDESYLDYLNCSLMTASGAPDCRSDFASSMDFGSLFTSAYDLEASFNTGLPIRTNGQQVLQGMIAELDRHLALTHMGDLLGLSKASLQNAFASMDLNDGQIEYLLAVTGNISDRRDLHNMVSRLKHEENKARSLANRNLSNARLSKRNLSNKAATQRAHASTRPERAETPVKQRSSVGADLRAWTHSSSQSWHKRGSPFERPGIGAINMPLTAEDSSDEESSEVVYEYVTERTPSGNRLRIRLTKDGVSIEPENKYLYQSGDRLVRSWPIIGGKDYLPAAWLNGWQDVVADAAVVVGAGVDLALLIKSKQWVGGGWARKLWKASKLNRLGPAARSSPPAIVASLAALQLVTPRALVTGAGGTPFLKHCDAACRETMQPVDPDQMYVPPVHDPNPFQTTTWLDVYYQTDQPSLSEGFGAGSWADR